MAEIEDRVYEQVNVKINYGDQKRKILNNSFIVDKGGVFNNGRANSSYQDRFAPKPRAGSSAGSYRRNLFVNSCDVRQNANNTTLASNYQTTISKAQAMQNITNHNYGKHE